MAGKEESLKLVVKKARAAFSSGKTKSFEFRQAQLKNLLQLIKDHEETMADVVYKDLHKPRQETIGAEVIMPQNDVISALENLSNWMAPQAVEKGFVNKMDTCQIIYEPLGVALIIGAWNYPVQLILMPLIGAIAAGNCAVIKPSEISPATAEFFEKYIPQYLDQDCYPVVNGGIPETQCLLSHKFDKIFYTGSSAVGKLVMEAAAKNLTRVTLELGGKSPCYVDEDSNLQIVARRVVWGRFMNAGQTCVAPDYILCKPGIQSELIKQMKEALFEFYGEDPHESPHYGRIVNERHFNRVKALMGSGTCVIGGETDSHDNFIAPTVLTGVKADDAIMESEIFGPLLPIVDVTNIDEAVEFINEREKPLALYVFSNDQKKIQYVVDNTSSGGVCVNDCLLHCAVDTLPFGGVGASGMGEYHGKFTFDSFSHRRACLMKKQAMESMNSIRYPPFKNFGWMRWIMSKRDPAEHRISYIPLFVLGILGAILMKILGLPRYFLTK